MLKTRIIPTLLWKDMGLVKGSMFNNWRRVGSLAPAVKVYNTRQVDEMLLLDITATSQNRGPDLDMIHDATLECFCPLTVGGGITSIDDVRRLLRAGADKVCLNTSLITHPKLLSQIANTFGTQCVVASIDVKKNKHGKYCCYIRCGSKIIDTNIEKIVDMVQTEGAGEIVLTSIDRDGSLQGYDIPLIKKITKLTHIPVIASGGAGEHRHFYQAITAGASAVAAASIFHFTQYTPQEIKSYLAAKGIPVRK